MFSCARNHFWKRWSVRHFNTFYTEQTHSLLHQCFRAPFNWLTYSATNVESFRLPCGRLQVAR